MRRFKCGPLDFPSEKSFLLILPMNRVQLFWNSPFLCRHRPKMIFGQTTPVDSDRKCKFQKFCPARSDRNNVAHGILSCYKLRDVFSQFTDKIWELQLKYFPYQRDQRRPFSSTLICISKIHYFVRKNSQNAGVNRAEKVYQCIVYTPMRSQIASNPRVSFQLPSTNCLKTTQIHVFAQLRLCQRSFA